MKEAIHTISHSQGIKANGFVFISGQLAWDPATGKLVAGGIEAQTEQVLEILLPFSRLAAAAGKKF